MKFEVFSQFGTKVANLREISTNFDAFKEKTQSKVRSLDENHLFVWRFGANFELFYKHAKEIGRI